MDPGAESKFKFLIGLFGKQASVAIDLLVLELDTPCCRGGHCSMPQQIK